MTRYDRVNLVIGEYGGDAIWMKEAIPMCLKPIRRQMVDSMLLAKLSVKVFMMLQRTGLQVL